MLTGVRNGNPIANPTMLTIKTARDSEIPGKISNSVAFNPRESIKREAMQTTSTNAK